MINIKNINKLGAIIICIHHLWIRKYLVVFIKYNNYNPIVIIVGLFFSVLIIVFVGVYSHLQIKKGWNLMRQIQLYKLLFSIFCFH